MALGKISFSTLLGKSAFNQAPIEFGLLYLVIPISLIKLAWVLVFMQELLGFDRTF